LFAISTIRDATLGNALAGPAMANAARATLALPVQIANVTLVTFLEVVFAVFASGLPSEAKDAPNNRKSKNDVIHHDE